MAKPIPTGRDLSNPRSFQSNRSVDLSKVPGAVAAAARAAAQGYGAARGGIGAALGSTASAASRPFSASDAERFGPYVPNLQGAGMPAGSTVSIPGSPSRGRVDNAIKQIAADLAANEFGANRRSRGTVNPFESATSGAGAGIRPPTDYSAADIGSLGALAQSTGVPSAGGLDNLQAGINAAIARATQPQGGLGALEGETAARQRPRTEGSRGGFELADALSILGGVPNTGTGTPPPGGKLPPGPPGPPPPGPPPPPPGPPPPPPGVPGDPVVPVSDTIRSLYGELSTRDFSNMIRNMMAERETNLRGLNQQSVDQLAASVLRRTGQIGDIKTALETELGVLDADRAGVQQGLVDAVALRAQEMQAGTDASLTAAREGLGDQVTDEFEKVAQIVGSQAGSQAMSSQDAMARLAQVADMAAAERLAAPAQLASEAELALGDDEFAYTQALQSNLTEALAGLDAEEAERVLGEAMRQENFNIGRDQRMIEALVGDFVRKDTQAFQAGQAQLGRDFSADQAQLGRDFSADQAQLGRDFSAGQSALSRLFQQSERVASQNFKTEQAEIVRAANEDAARIKQEASVMATQAEAADEQTAADLYKVDVAIWRQMTGSERQALREDWIETQRLAGIGSEAFPMGTMQNLEQKYSKLDPEFFVHVNAMLGIDTLKADNPEEAENLREKYLEALRITDDYGAKGLSAAETSIIDTLYAELAGDVAAVARQNRNLANDSRSMQQRERTGALTR
jgi:hypothetical protein